VCKGLRVSDTKPVPALSDLLIRLGALDDEQAVVSLAAWHDGNAWRLRFGSLIIGPSDMARLSWREWFESDGLRDPWPGRADLAQWRRFDTQVGAWRLIRFPLEVDKVEPWLGRLIDFGEAETPDGGAPLIAEPGPADTLKRIFHLDDSPAARLACMVGRPLLGWTHSLDHEPGVPDDGFPPKDVGATDGHTMPTLAVLGLAVDTSSRSSTRPALLVARTDQPAWIAEVRGGGAPPDLVTFNVRLRWNVEEAALWEFVLDLEEADRDGDLLAARRLALAGVPLPAELGGQCTVQMPTFGRQVTRRVRLYHRNGTLLDAANDVHLLENIELSISLDVPGQETMTTTSSVGTSAQPSLPQRLEAQDRIVLQYADWLANGVAGRVVAVGDDGRARLRALLGDARVRLAVLDPYFGSEVADWSLLRDVGVPVRVLTRKDRSTIPTDLPNTIEVREWPTKNEPFHDRWYLWVDGGLTVGTSPNGLGRKLSLFDWLEPPVASHLLQLFDSLWPQAQPRA